MSEEEKKEKYKPRVISRIALLLGIVTFFSGLLLVPFTLWFALIPDAGGDLDFIGMFFTFVAIPSIFSAHFILPIAAIGLVLSIVALFIERDISHRLLPLVFFIVGICFYAMCYAVGYIRG
jgi:hypothetical protein